VDGEDLDGGRVTVQASGALAGDGVRVAVDLLAQPGGGSVAERVRRDVLLQAGALGGATDDRAEDRDGQPFAGKAADDRLVGAGGERVAPPAGRGADATCSDDADNSETRILGRLR